MQKSKKGDSMLQKRSNSSGKTLKVFRLALIVLFALGLMVLSYTVTTAYFMDESITSTGEPNIVIVGTISLDVDTNFNFENLALAPDTLYTGSDVQTTIATGTTNNIDTVYVRVKFENTCERLEIVINKLAANGNVDYNSAQHENHWVLGEDGYYYYLGEIGSSPTIFNDGYKTDNSFHNGIAGDPVELTITVEGIQRPYGAYDSLWQTAPQLFKSFAKANSGYPQNA